MLDINTITVLIILSALIVAPVQLFAARRYKGYIGRAVACWGSGLAISGIGHACLLVRGHAPDFIPMILGNTLVIGSAAGYTLAIRMLKRQKLRILSLAAPTACACLLFGVFLYGHNNVAARVIVANLGLLALLLQLCHALFVNVDPEKRSTYWPTGVLIGWVVLVLLFRTWATFDGYYMRHPALLASSGLQSLLFSSSFIVTVVGGIFFMLMASDEFAAQIAKLASLDSLTAIFNRRAFENLASRSLANNHRAGKVSSLLTLDLDYFKTVNDRFGHSAGDQALKDVSAAIAHQLRAGDIFGRYGGEEFCVLLPGTSTDEALVVAERLRQAVQQLPFHVGNGELVLTISVGVATDKGLEKTLATLFAESDQALYQAKSMGRNCVAMWGAHLSHT